MALVLTQPNHIMYLPLSNYLLVKASLDYSTIPELYTFLHSSDVNFKEQRKFILELLKDGLRNEKDFVDFMRSMAYKLFSELYSSSICEISTKLLVLEVLDVLTNMPIAVRMLTENQSLLSQLYIDVHNILQDYQTDNCVHSLIDKIVSIMLNITKIVQDKNTIFISFSIMKDIFLHEIFSSLSNDSKKNVLNCMYIMFGIFPTYFSQNLLELFLQRANDPLSKYWYTYGCHFIDIKSLAASDENHYLRLLVNDYKSVKLDS